MHSPWFNDCLINRNAKSNIFYLRSVVTQTKPTESMTTSQPFKSSNFANTFDT